MPSRSLQRWMTESLPRLDEVERAHGAVRGSELARRTATQQINQAYVLLLAARFQSFCRDLHSECVGLLVASLEPASMRQLVREALLSERKLDRQNARSETVSRDFDRFGIKVWGELERADPRMVQRRRDLDELNAWRNAIAHHDFSGIGLQGRTQVRLEEVRRWRGVCSALARGLDEAMGRHLSKLTGRSPW